jgi:hypothetical protein
MALVAGPGLGWLGQCREGRRTTPSGVALALLYVIVTRGRALISSRRYLCCFGMVTPSG